MEKIKFTFDETNEEVDCLNIETEDIKKKQILSLKNTVTKKKFNE